MSTLKSIGEASDATRVPAVLFVAASLEELRRALRRGALGGGDRPLALFVRRRDAAREGRERDVLLKVEGRAAALAGTPFRRAKGKGAYEADRVPLQFVACSRLPKALDGLERVEAAGGIVVRMNGTPQILLLQKGKKKDVQWVLPKGRRRKRESLVDAAAREVLEETGLREVWVRKPLRREQYFDDERGRIVFKRVTYYLMHCPPEGAKVKVQKAEGFRKGRWVTFDEALALTRPLRAHSALEKARDAVAKLA